MRKRSKLRKEEEYNKHLEVGELLFNQKCFKDVNMWVFVLWFGFSSRQQPSACGGAYVQISNDYILRVYWSFFRLNLEL